MFYRHWLLKYSMSKYVQISNTDWECMLTFARRYEMKDTIQDKKSAHFTACLSNDTLLALAYNYFRFQELHISGFMLPIDQQNRKSRDHR